MLCRADSVYAIVPCLELEVQAKTRQVRRVLPSVSDLERREGDCRVCDNPGVSDVPMEILTTHGPSAVKANFNTAAGSPTSFCLVERTGIVFGAHRTEIRVCSAARMHKSQAAGAVHQDLRESHAQAGTQRSIPTGVLLHGDVVTGAGKRRAVVLGDRRHGLGSIHSRPIEVELGAEDEIVTLPVIADLAAADDPGRIRAQGLRRKVDELRCRRERIDEGVRIAGPQPMFTPT